MSRFIACSFSHLGTILKFNSYLALIFHPFIIYLLTRRFSLAVTSMAQLTFLIYSYLRFHSDLESTYSVGNKWIGEFHKVNCMTLQMKGIVDLTMIVNMYRFVVQNASLYGTSILEEKRTQT